MRGHPIHPSAARVLEALGGDPSHFAAQQLTPAAADNADLILTMTLEHRDDVLKVAPHQLRKTFTLREAAWLAAAFSPQKVEELATFRPWSPSNRTWDIPDPMGRDDAFFGMVGAQIADLVPAIVNLCQRG